MCAGGVWAIRVLGEEFTTSRRRREEIDTINRIATLGTKGQNVLGIIPRQNMLGINRPQARLVIHRRAIICRIATIVVLGYQASRSYHHRCHLGGKAATVALRAIRSRAREAAGDVGARACRHCSCRYRALRHLRVFGLRDFELVGGPQEM